MSQKDSYPNGIAVVMIAKNEEVILSTSLPRLSKIADEIIFVDTGSNDQTIEIAKQHGCKVFSFQWCDDFSAQKITQSCRRISCG